MTEHHINIEETINLVSFETHPNINKVQQINEEVGKFPPWILECCIYKVHDRLRKVKPEAYEPMLVSIGPYHLQNKKLQEMRKHKMQYLNSLLERREEESVERYFLELKNLEDATRRCYAGPIDVMSSDEFVEMMLLDGCFIIEFFRRIYGTLVDRNDDPIFNMGWMQWQIFRDMMLLENQLPYFVLSQLYDMTTDPKEKVSFREMAMSCFNNTLPKPGPNKIYVGGNDIDHIEPINHLLHLIHTLCRPLPEGRSSKSSDSNEISDQMRPLLEERSIEIHEVSDQMRPSSEERTQMRSAVELQEAGVKFKKVGKVFNQKDSNDTVSLFEIMFHHGLMEVPCFKVDDLTDTFFRNLIAYEQHSLYVNRKYFTDFAIFLNQLINTKNDVKLLRQEGIIVNLLGDDDKKVCDMVNMLNEGLILSSTGYNYAELCKKVNKHCKKPWNKMVATLRSRYFHNVAGMLFVLTLVQTIVALITLCT